MKRLLLPTLLLVVAASVALASLPCRSREEALAESVAGFFLTQAVAAAGCDKLLGGNGFNGLHERITAQYAAQIGSATDVRAAYFRRAYGDAWERERDRVHAFMTELLTTTMAINADNCGRMKEELERRLAGGWEPILQRLIRRMESIARRDQNICVP